MRVTGSRTALLMAASLWVVTGAGCGSDSASEAAGGGGGISGGGAGGGTDSGGRDGAAAAGDDSGLQDGAGDGDGASTSCAANATERCDCSHNAIGSRRCSPDGRGWGTCQCETYGAEFYVSPTGDDQANGSRGAPFATLERARDAIRSLKAGSGLPVGGVVVWLRGGIHQRSSTFDLGASDSGTDQSPVVYRGTPGETARVLGGKKLGGSAFQPVTSASLVWDRLDPAAQGKVVQIDLGRQGITDYGTLRQRGMGGGVTAALELFVDGKRLPLGRWPDAHQDDPSATPLDAQVTLYGTGIVPDVTGLYVKDGEQDGVSSFSRQGQVGGKQYHLARYTWQYQGAWNTAWFLSTTATGYPSNADPWWYRYSEELGPMDGSAGAQGKPTTDSSTAIHHGFARIATRVSDSVFTYAGDRPNRWTQAQGVWFHGFFRYSWADWHIPAANIDTGSRTVTLVNDARPYGLDPTESGGPYYAYNLIEEITEPGEWYLDRSTGMLYLWPPGDLAGADIVVSLIESPLIRLKGASYLRVQDVSFEASRDELVRVEDGANNVIVGCTLHSAGTRAASVSGVNNGLSRCNIYETGDGGVLLTGGDRPTLTRAGNYVENNHIHDFSQWCWTYTPAVLTSSTNCGLKVRHNLIHDATHTAILFGGNEHVIELNEIHHVCSYSSDAGAIYTGRDWGFRGNLVRHNFIHHIATSIQGYGVHGVYLDDCVSGLTVTGNVLYQITGFGIQHGGGRDNIITNNVIVHCGTGLAADSRGATWTSINATPGDSWNLLEKLQKVGYQSATWSAAYPECAAIPNSYAQIDAPGALWKYPQGCVFSRNLGFANKTWRGGDMTGKPYDYYREIADNVEDQDPLFVNEANLDLTLQPGSPAYAIPGFQEIPFANIGIEH